MRVLMFLPRGLLVELAANKEITLPLEEQRRLCDEVFRCYAVIDGIPASLEMFLKYKDRIRLMSIEPYDVLTELEIPNESVVMTEVMRGRDAILVDNPTVGYEEACNTAASLCLSVVVIKLEWVVAYRTWDFAKDFLGVKWETTVMSSAMNPLWTDDVRIGICDYS